MRLVDRSTTRSDSIVRGGRTVTPIVRTWRVAVPLPNAGLVATRNTPAGVEVVEADGRTAVLRTHNVTFRVRVALALLVVAVTIASRARRRAWTK